jgi:hypothetical protein
MASSHKYSKGKLVVYLQQPPSFGNYNDSADPDTEQTFISDIRALLARNKAVVVKGWHPQIRMDFSVNEFRRHGYQLEREVNWQGNNTLCFRNLL